MVNDYNLELVRQKPINYNGLIFYPIEFGYICDNIGLDFFDRLLMPFLITKDCLELDSNTDIEKINLFTDVVLRNDTFLQSLVFILEVFCKCISIKLTNDNTLLLTLENHKTFIIDSNNFEDVCTIIMKINYKEKISVEKPPENMSDRQRDVWQKLQHGRKKEKEKNTVHICDILNICEFGGDYRIPIEDIDHWTLWKIMNCYKARTNMKTYDDSLKICLVSGDGKNISGNNHWLHKLLVHE